MDDGGRCLLDVIGDPSALEFFLGSSDEHISDAQSISLASGELKKVGITNCVSSSHLITSKAVFSTSNAILRTAASQSSTSLPATGQAVPNHAPVPSSSPSPYQASAPSPAASPTLSFASKSPMPPPSQSPSPMSSRRSPAQAPIHSMPCPSPTGYPITQSPSAPQGLYQVRSPASSPLPASFTTLQLNKVQTTTSMAPATINILQQQPATLPTSSATTPSTLQQLPGTTIPVGGQIMQIIQAPHQAPTIRHQTTMKPIQPKPQQILPKPAGASSQNPYSKSMALSQRNAVSLTANQANSLVIGQGQTMIPGSNVQVGPQGTLLFNHISLGVGQNNILFPGNSGIPHNLQLLVRPQPPHNATNAASQNAATMAQASSMNNAFLTALHVQNQAAQQAFIGQTKSLAGQGQVVIPGQNLGPNGQAQLSNAGLRQGMISGARVVGQAQGPLVLQQIQGPITVIQALQGQNMGQIGGMIQGQAFQGTVTPGIQQSIVLNNQHPSVITTSSAGMPTLVNQVGEQGQITQVAQLQQQNSLPVPHQPSQPKPQGVNLEELLKQAGIMPEDSPPSPPPPTSQMPIDPHPIASFAQMTTVPIVNGPQTVVVNQEHIPGQNAQSPLLAHLQQPIMSSHLQAAGAMQGQVKLSLAQDGSVIIQRPVFPGQGPTLSVSPSQQQMASQQVAIPVACFSTATTTTTTTTSNVMTTVPVSSHQVQSVLLQRLNSVPQTSVAQQQPSPSSSPAVNATASIIPMSVQGMNVNLVQGLQASPTCSVATSTGPMVMSVSSPQNVTVSTPAFSSTANTILSSMLSQSNPMLTQSLSQDGRISAECVTNSFKQQNAVSSAGATFVPNGNKILHQNPLLIQSLTTLNSNVGPLASIPVSSNSITLTSASPSISQAATMMSGEANHIVPVSFAISAVPTVLTNSVATTATSNITAMPKNSAPRVILSGYPFTNLQPGQKVQTIQLTHQAQEALQKVQAQLQNLMSHKSLSLHQRKQVQQLQMEQQKILSQGKLISVQQQPINQHIQMNQQHQPQLQQLQQPRYLHQKPIASAQSTTSHKNSQATSHKSTKLVSNNANNNSVLASTLMQGATHMASFQVATTLSTTQALMTSSTSPSVITTASSTTHLKFGNQIIALTAQQQRPVQPQSKPLTPEQQHQILFQNQAKQQLFLKLHHQQQQQQAANTLAQDQPITVAPNVQTLNFTGGILQIQTVAPGITHLKPICPAVFPDQINRGIKRTATMPLSRTARIQQQLAADQNGVLHPDCKTPFTSREDACKRLLKYHVYNNRSPTIEDLDRADALFETVSGQLLEKAKNMFGKYRYLLLRESMKGNTTAEQVMLDRMFMQEETSSLEKDRQAVKEGKDLELPPVPDHWLKIKTEAQSNVPEVAVAESNLGAPPSFSNFATDSNFDVNCVKVKQELEGTAAIAEYEDVSDNNSSVSLEYGRREDEGTAVVKQEKVRNYDEWAEIQKELEMYPIERDEAGATRIDFEPSDDTTTTLADFDPPVPKVPKNDDTSSGDNSHHPPLHPHPSIVLQPHLISHHNHPHESRLLSEKSNQIEMETESNWDDALGVHTGVTSEAVNISPCASSVAESEPVEVLLMQHRHNSHDDASDLGLDDMDDLEEPYGNALTEDEDSLSRCIPRTNHVGSYEGSNSCELGGLFETNYKSSSTDFHDVPNGSFSRSSQDDDLNAQVQSAINSILNLQRIDDSCDAFMKAGVTRENLKSVQTSTLNNNTECEENSLAVSERNSHYTFNVAKHKEALVQDEEEDEDEEEEDEEEEEEIDSMDYEDVSATTDLDSFRNDGPSEIDVALDEAVKSILL